MMLEIKTKEEFDASKVSDYIKRTGLKGVILKKNKIFIPHKIKKKTLKDLIELIDIAEISYAPYICTYNTNRWKEEYLYPQVERGEIYVCDFGDSVDSELHGKRYAIIIQNDKGNEFSPTTIVIPCTTRRKRDLPVHCRFKLSKENMEVSNYTMSQKNNIALAEGIRTISKKRLIERIGKMSDEFMEENIDPIIKCSLGLD